MGVADVGVEGLGEGPGVEQDGAAAVFGLGVGDDLSDGGGSGACWLAVLGVEHGMPLPERETGDGGGGVAGLQKLGDLGETAAFLFLAECIAVDYAVMRALGVPNYVIRFNNRKVFRGLQSRIGVSDNEVMDAVMRSVDKFDKIGESGVRKELTELVGKGGFGENGLGTVLEFLKIGEGKDTNAARIDSLDAFLGNTELGRRGVDELREVLSAVQAMGVDDAVLQVDPTIVRGLDYYTGTVFETFLKDAPQFGSVMSGGRYDGLIGLFSSEEVPAVGISVGIDRLIAALEELNLLPKSKASAVVLVTVFGSETLQYSIRAARELRRAGINTELYLDANAKLAKQFKYASRKGIPLVVIAGPEEEKTGIVSLRSMDSGEQMQVSIDSLAQAVQDNYVDPDPSANTGRSWDWEFAEDMIDRVPQVGGVYLLRNEKHEVLKCGWAPFGKLPETIRASVSEDQREEVRTFDWYEIRDDKLSQALAEFMNQKLSPKFG